MEKEITKRNIIHKDRPFAKDINNHFFIKNKQNQLNGFIQNYKNIVETIHQTLP